MASRRSVCASRSASSASIAIYATRSRSRVCFRSTIHTAPVPRCQGFGNTIDFDLDLVIPDKSKTLNQGAIEPWTKPKYRPLFTELKRFAGTAGIPLDVPWADLEPRAAPDDHRRRR